MTTPLRFALVPVEQMHPRYLANNGPGNDLLERIVRAREEAKEHLWLNGPAGAGVEELIRLLDEIGGGHG